MKCFNCKSEINHKKGYYKLVLQHVPPTENITETVYRICNDCYVKQVLFSTEK